MMIDYAVIYTMILVGSVTAGMVLMLNGVVQLLVRNKTGVWKDGGAHLVAGVVVVGVSVVVLVVSGLINVPPPD
jgi:hypothetical protein